MVAVASQRNCRAFSFLRTLAMPENGNDAESGRFIEGPPRRRNSPEIDTRKFDIRPFRVPLPESQNPMSAATKAAAAAPAAAAATCAHATCGKELGPPLLCCSRCKTTTYCCKECQVQRFFLV